MTTNDGAAPSGKANATWRIFVAPLALNAGALLLTTLAQFNPRVVEAYYSRGLYPRLATVMSWLNGWAPFSLAEFVLTPLVVIALVAAAWRAWALYSRRASMFFFALLILSKILWVTGGGLTAFTLLWGLNYYRLPLSEIVNFERRTASAEELERVGRIVIDEINAHYLLANRDATNAAPTIDDSSRMGEELNRIFDEQAAFLKINQASRPAVPKLLLCSPALTRLGISGIFIPFTGEPSVNAEVPAFDLPFAAAHELAHQRGFAREDEANFIAFLICVKSRDPLVRYAGHLNALRVLSLLARVAPERARSLAAELQRGPRADLQTRRAFWLKAGGRVGAIGAIVNDSYLKANGVRSGSGSYEDAATLIVSFYTQQNSDHITR